MRAFVWTRHALIVAACVWVTPRLAVAGPKPPARRPTGESTAKIPVTLTAVGDQLVITGDDPAAVARAYEMARLILEDKGQSYRAFRLQYADATEVAGVLDEWFNGPARKQSSPAFNPPWLALAQRGRGGQAASPPPPASPPKPSRVRVVADAENNSLLVRGNVLDLMAVQRMLETAIDVEPGGSEVAMKPFVIGPLKFAVATEVVRVLKQVYQQDLDQATVPGARRAARTRRPGQPLDPSGRPRPVTLTITADDRTNSVIGMAPGSMADDVRKIVGVLEEKAQVDTKAVEIVPPAGIDPDLFRNVLDAIQTRPPAARR